ncbi:MAG TPA: radical SAM protein [Candidatus Methanoculleus thermohydrogenotrophicum]|jgi:radical SAM superfamily enzyme with C-terminal helix-hairpin-helix motif|nr:radical SAM protein [Candidatus Methanoculleus thermohydrogenotrophicum]NLM82786.1 radical SAM protein [Candidatus Methanoculleus thermohydrogenotrophicum]HOB18046.1 radical SAM protein [Candidatus Methanoculleus thermohydrogenotrophicum]HPZ38127.1 radical SAM protein [Candidatus Methanoculleus thermohydrogenotrophicum]HQC91000.1 radical SAM protein [Candidatus Methanoculleus thermohydrogenotrophicum]
MTSSALIIDGYVDEPACLGVAPYISPYVREVAGVLIEHGYVPGYVTIDQVRSDPALVAGRGDDLVVMIAGRTVPGTYIGGKPATLTEIQQLGLLLREPTTVIGGPITFGYAPGGGERAIRQAIAGFDVMLQGSPAVALDAWLSGGEPAGVTDYSRTDHWCIAGAGIIARHPAFPYVMCELETATGCSRATVGGCSFCTEPFYGLPRYRSIEGIAEEVAALRAAGARHFRLGRQPDLLAYQSSGGEFPVPRPEVLRDLFSAIRARAPDLLTLHIDNINPGTIARHEEAAREALAAIVDGHTPGDTAAFGMETADPAVVVANNLKAMPDDVFRAIEIVNEIGGKRSGGIPELLPGLNFVIGLAGETPATFDANEAFLRRVLDAGLLVRRVNIRQVMLFEGTAVYEKNTLGMHDTRFRAFKEWTRREFDGPMLSRIFPTGTILRDVVVEVSGKLSFGRQMGSYPILVGIPLVLPVGSVLDTVVVDQGMRSVTALPCPVEVNTLPVAALRWIPGIGKKRSAAIAARRPFGSLAEFRKVAGKTPVDGVMVF